MNQAVSTRHSPGSKHLSPPEWGTVSVRHFLYRWLLDPDTEGNHQAAIDQFIAILIIANLAALVFEHVPAIHDPYKQWFHWFDIASVAIFTVEYLARLYLAPEDHEFRGKSSPRLSYMVSPFAIIDLVAILPFYLAAFVNVDLRMLRALRLLRILKLFRVLIPAAKEFAVLNRGRTFRQKVHALVWPSEFGGQLHDFFDSFIMFWVVVSVAAVVLESVAHVHYILNLEFIILDTVAVAIFTVEYLLRIYSVVETKGFRHPIAGRLRYARTGNAIVDFLAVIPFFLEALLHHLFDLRFLRIFRLLRLLKLTKYTGATTTLAIVIKREWPVMASATFIMFLLVVLTACLGYLFEHDAQPDKFENIPTSIYWAVITLASVGYGDISPVTPIGRAITIVLALLGIGIFAIPAAVLSSAFSDQLRIEREELKNELYEMLADGSISADEQEIIDREAKRLHLNADEVSRLVEKAKREREGGLDHKGLSITKLAERPDVALERYRELVGQMSSIAANVDASRIDRLIADPELTTAYERRIWESIRDNSRA